MGSPAPEYSPGGPYPAPLRDSSIKGSGSMTRSNRTPRRWHRAAASVILAAGFVSAFPAAAHAAPATVVTIQFDDGNADVYQWISALSNHGFHATFYVNSGSIDTAGKITRAHRPRPHPAAK